MKSFKLLLTVLVIFSFGEIANSSENNDKVSGKVLSYGIYKLFKSKSDFAEPNSVTGKILLIEKFTHIETTEIIPLILGNSFGFKFRISNIPTDRFSNFTFVVTHPPIRNSSGVYQTKSLFEMKGISPLAEIEDHFTYEFTDPDELVPGDWTLEIWRNKIKLVSKTFIVK